MAETPRRVAKDILQTIGSLLLLYPCWLGMMAVHEGGHVLHAWVSGGHVERVVIPLLDFSRTDVHPNPWPRFVAWGGPVWGCLVPLGLWGIARRARGVRGTGVLQFFAGFCLVANGAYVGVGWLLVGGDAADLRRWDTPVWILIAFGLLATSLGLWLWHRLGRAPAGFIGSASQGDRG